MANETNTKELNVEKTKNVVAEAKNNAKNEAAKKVTARFT